MENLLTKESQLLGSLLCNKEHKEFHIQETKYDKAIQKEFKIIKILFVWEIIKKQKEINLKIIIQKSWKWKDNIWSKK